MVHLTLRALALLARLLIRSRLELVVENLALRQQLAVFKQKRPRPRLRRADRLFWVLLRQAWPCWASVLLLIQPDTVVDWQRQGFRWLWRLNSRVKRTGRPRIPAEVRELIERMARDNGWGAPRIHGELLKLGIWVDERTVSRYLQKRPLGQTLSNGGWPFCATTAMGLAGMDFFAVPTATFQFLWVFFALHHDRRRVLHFAVTDDPGPPVDRPATARGVFFRPGTALCHL